MVKWANVISKQLLEIKGIRCIYLKVLMIKSDTYHDTCTNYLMEQEPPLIQDQAEGDGCCCADKTSLTKEEKDGPSRAMLGSILLSILHVWDLWASRHDLLLITKNRG
jgi:hypothetical protein